LTQKKIIRMTDSSQYNSSYSLAYGALDTVQVINASKYLTSIYVSGW